MRRGKDPGRRFADLGAESHRRSYARHGSCVGTDEGAVGRLPARSDRTGAADGQSRFPAGHQRVARRFRHRAGRAHATLSGHGDHGAMAIRLLNRALAIAQAAARRCERQYAAALRSQAPALAAAALAHANDAELHTRLISARIGELGGETAVADLTPNATSSPNPSEARLANSLPALLCSHLMAERDAIKSYFEISLFFRPFDAATQCLVEEIAASAEKRQARTLGPARHDLEFLTCRFAPESAARWHRAARWHGGCARRRRRHGAHTRRRTPRRDCGDAHKRQNGAHIDVRAVSSGHLHRDGTTVPRQRSGSAAGARGSQRVRHGCAAVGVIAPRPRDPHCDPRAPAGEPDRCRGANRKRTKKGPAVACRPLAARCNLRVRRRRGPRPRWSPALRPPASPRPAA